MTDKERWTFAGRYYDAEDGREWLQWDPTPEMIARRYTPYHIVADYFWSRHELDYPAKEQA